MYKIVKEGSEILCIIETASNMFIPIDEANRHYQAYVAYSQNNPVPVYDMDGNQLEG